VTQGEEGPGGGSTGAKDGGERAVEAKADDDESEDEGMGVVAMRDEAVSAEPIWQLEDCAACSDEDAVKGFLLETLRQACADFLRHRDYKGVAYFLHAGADSQQRALSSVNVALGFRSKGSNQECHECLRALASEKQVSLLLYLPAAPHVPLVLRVGSGPGACPNDCCARQPPQTRGPRGAMDIALARIRLRLAQSQRLVILPARG